MDNIAYINQDQETLIKLIEKILTEAKNGDLTSIVAVGFYKNSGNTMNCMCISDDDNKPAIIGEMVLAQRDVIDVFCQTRRQPLWDCCE